MHDARAGWLVYGFEGRGGGDRELTVAVEDVEGVYDHCGGKVWDMVVERVRRRRGALRRRGIGLL